MILENGTAELYQTLGKKGMKMKLRNRKKLQVLLRQICKNRDERTKFLFTDSGDWSYGRNEWRNGDKIWYRYEDLRDTTDLNNLSPGLGIPPPQHMMLVRSLDSIIDDINSYEATGMSTFRAVNKTLMDIEKVLQEMINAQKQEGAKM